MRARTQGRHGAASIKLNCQHLLLAYLLCGTLLLDTVMARYSKYGSPLLAYSRDQRNAARLTPDDYNRLRADFMHEEAAQTLGADIKLNEREQQANDIIMAVKLKEFEEGLVTPHLFKPSQHFFSVIEDIRASELFYYLQHMPKGGVLHAHDTALCSTDYIIKLTYWDDLWVCQQGGDLNAVDLRFSRERPAANVERDCTWELLSVVRKQRTADAVDEYLREQFTLYPTEKFEDNNAAWQKFMQIFGLLDGVLMYAPAWSDYYYNALKEFNDDNVQYLEFRTTLPILYDMDNNDYTHLDTVRIYKETLDRFKHDYPEFIGSRMIYAPIRNTDGAGMAAYIKICIEIMDKYPDFVAGFDLVGQEEMGQPLKEFIPQLLDMPSNINFFFHAGETNWFGSSVDENLIDAVLLGTKRIGHGFALVKHPAVLKMLKERNIAIEVNPISNQVLQLVSDYRNHPCAHFFADNYPVVISSDDPSFWKASPLSHDFYIAFLGIASAHADLRLLKKLAFNSLQYSAMTDGEKAIAIEKWQKEWDDFIDFVLTGGKNAAYNIRTNRID